MFRPEVKEKIEQELAHGAEARAAGFEGRARVCARRAAGAAACEYLQVNGTSYSGLNAIDLLEAILGLPGIPDEINQSV